MKDCAGPMGSGDTVRVTSYALVMSGPETRGDPDYRADHGAFFGSLNGTLNHLLATDRIWMRRFTGEGDAPTALDVILHDDLADLRAARSVEDARIIGWVEGLDE
eukprot:gene28564-31896_t